MIVLARKIEPEYRRVRTINEQLDERERQAYTKVTEAITLSAGIKG